MRKFTGFLVAVLLLICASLPPTAAEDATMPAAEKGARDAAQALAAIGAGPGPTDDLAALAHQRFKRTLSLLESDFPADYAVLSAQIRQIASTGIDEKNFTVAVFHLLTELRRKYAYKIVYAPTVSHAVILGRLADFYDRVFSQEGALVCGRFAHEGSAALLELGHGAKYAELLDQQAAAYFEAVIEAIEAPDYVGVAEQRDWGIVLETMIKAGLPRSYVAAISSGRGTDPDLCPAYSALFRGAGVIDSREAARIRADFAKNLTGY